MNTLILVTDAARARLFRPEAEPTLRGMPVLKEVASLVHPEARIPESQRFSDSSPNSAIGGAGYQTFDDHRGDHEHEERRRFARQVVETLGEHAAARTRVVLCATHSMHALLESELQRVSAPFSVRWIAGEYTKLTAPELAERLHAAGAA